MKYGKRNGGNINGENRNQRNGNGNHLKYQ
jgi:hypothetical protein